MPEIHAVQWFENEVWRTLYLSSYPHDVSDTYRDIRDLTDKPLRAVKFVVDNFDFVAAQCKDFAVLAYRKGETA